MQVKRNAIVARGVEEAYGFIHDIVEVQYHGHPDLRQVVVPVEEVRLLLNEVGKGQQWDYATIIRKTAERLRKDYRRVSIGYSGMHGNPRLTERVIVVVVDD